jgi:hypothetical protein
MKVAAAKLLGKVGPGVRAGIAAGLTAGLVVSLMLVGHSGGGSVNVQNTATEAPVPTTDATLDTTTTTIPTTTTTSEASTTVTTVRVVTTTTTIAAPTTTTTAPPIPPNVGAMQIVPEGVSLYFYNHNPEAFPNSKVRVSITTADGTNEVVAPLPGLDHGRFTVPAPGATDATVVDTEWDGGRLPNGAGELAH